MSSPGGTPFINLLFARRVAGYVRGALSGFADNPALGLPSTVGTPMIEEWLHGITSATDVGDLRWQESSFQGVQAYSHVTPTAPTERGIIQIGSGPNANDGGELVYPAVGDRPFNSYPPPGFIWATKLRNVTEVPALQRTVFSGFVQLVGVAAGAVPTGVANPCDFVGIRHDPTVAGVNVFGVVRAGTAESTVDLGVDIDSWRIVGFEHLKKVSDGSSLGFQFFVLDCSIPWRTKRTDVGSPITSASGHFPTNALTPVALGIQTKTSAGRQAQSDFWNLGGNSAR